ncbi:MAG TPA: DNA methyltransferase, partial [Aggregatilineales bacterium]|nr:DNA methyltransferase [Aggregatilineales bacterium]
LIGGLIETAGKKAGFYLYDRRIWVKDPSWQNSKWHTLSYRAVDEFEYLYIFWKPGITTVDRNKLSREEWSKWGSRAVWHIPSVRANDDHEAKFPLELARRVIKLFSAKGDT